MKRMYMIAGGVVLLAAGSFYGWHEWTHSPTYSLKQLASAFERRDRYEFEKYVDVDSIFQTAMADAVEGNPLATALGPAVAASLKTQIIKGVEEGNVTPDSPVGKALTKFRASPTVSVTRDGRNAYFPIETTTNGGARFVLKIHMTQVPDGYWRVDRVANFKELKAAEAEEERQKKLAIAKANEEKLAKLRVVAKLHTSVRGDWEWEKKNRFQIRFENKSDQAMASMTGHLRFPAQGFDEEVRGKLDLGPGEAASYTWQVDANRFMEPTMKVFALGETTDFDVEVDSITMADGTKVRRGSEE